MSNEHKTSAPPFSQLRVKCPYCGYNNAMIPKNKPGDEEQCGNCYHTYVIGK